MHAAGAIFHPRSSRKRDGLGWLPTCVLLLAQAVSAQVISNVTVVNITPSSFSVVWAGLPGFTPSISVFADAAGGTDLAGQLGIEYYPLHTGDPALTNAYDRRLNQALLRQKTVDSGLYHARVSGCSPSTTYYYSVRLANTNAQIASPAMAPFPAVTTAQETPFLLQSRQLLITVPGIDPSGAIVLLSNANTPSVLAAVAGDGVSSNQVYFSVNDLLAASGATNFLPLGNQTFTASVLGVSRQSVAQTYSLSFSTDFLVGQENQFAIGRFLALVMGSALLHPGDSGSIPITLYASAVTNLSFVLDLPTNRFSSLSLQGFAPQLSAAILQSNGSGSLRISFSTAVGQVLQGNQQIAQLNFTLATNQPSAYLPVQPQGLQVANADSSVSSNIVVQAGSLVIVGQEPLLQALLAPDRARSLALYGKPGSSYDIQSSTNLLNPNWAHFMRVPLTNILEVFHDFDTSQATVFYRAYEFVTAQPILDVNGAGQVVLYGTPWSGYEVDYASSTNPPSAWHLLSRVPLTNSFQILGGIKGAAAYQASIISGQPPVLDARSAGTERSLVVYGLPGTNYQLQFATNLSEVVTWYPLLNYSLTNAFQSVTNLGANSGPAVFYRIFRP